MYGKMKGLSSRALLLRFAATSLVAFLGIGIGLWLVLSRQLEQGAEIAARQHAVFVTGSIFEDQLTQDDLQRPVMPGTRRYQELHRFVYSHIIRIQFTVVRFKVWAPDGRILFSDEPRIVGRRFDVEPDLKAAFSGQTASTLSDLTAKENVFERDLAPSLFETYVPLYLNGRPHSGRPPAVAEVYTDLGAVRDQVTRTFRPVMLALLLGLLVLYALNFPIVRRMSRALTHQNLRLEKLLRQERRTVAELQELNRMKTEFVAVASHELRTPLTSMIGYAKTLKRPEVSGDDVRQELLQGIERQGDRLSGLLDNLLSAAQLDRGGRFRIPEPFDMAEAVPEVIDRLGHRSRRVIRDTLPALPPIRADRRLIEVVLFNLLDNALKFSPEETRCHLGFWLHGKSLVLQVRDQGAGIPASKQARVFERFYQIDSSATRRYGGVGLGLSLVKELVDGAGGRVDLSSHEGRGSTFTVTLPLLERVEPADSLNGPAKAQAVR